MKEKNQGKSIKKRVLRALLYGILTILSLPLVLSFLLKQPLVQSLAVRKVASWVSEKTGDSLTIGLLDIDFFKGIEVRQLGLRDSLGTPMLRINRMNVSPAFFELLSGKFFIHSLLIDSVEFRLVEHKDKNNYSFINFIKKLFSGSNTSSSSSSAFKLNIKILKMNHVHFQLRSEKDTNLNAPQNTMNYSDIDVTQATIDARNFFIVNDSLGFHLINLSAHEKSGLFLQKLRSDVIISGKMFSFRNTLLVTNHSRINLDYSMRAKGWDAYSDFVDSVRMQGNFRPSELSLSDIGYFTPVMFKMKDRVKILGGRVDGPLSRLVGKKLDIKYGKETHFEGDVSMAGLPDFYSTYIVAGINKFETSVADLKTFVLPQDDPNIPVPGSIAPTEKFKLNGQFDGSYYNFFFRANIMTGSRGKMNLDMNLKADTGKFRRLAANFDAVNFPLSHFITMDSMVGNADFTAHLAILDTLGKQNTKFSVKIKHILANKYHFRNIDYQGDYRGDTLFSKLKVDDPHLILNTSGYSVLKKIPHFHFQLKLSRSDFKPLNLWEQKDFHLSGIATINFTGLNVDSLFGHIHMKNAIVGFGEDRYPVAQIDLKKSGESSGLQSVDLQSDLLDFRMKGQYHLATLGLAMGQFFNHYFPVLPKKIRSVPVSRIR